MSSAQRPILVQFGAGNIGRSLVGQLFSASGYEVVFIDAVPAIIEALNRERRYKVVTKGKTLPGQSPETLVEHVRGILATETEAVAEAVARADVIGTAVGPAVLPRIMPAIAAGLRRRERPISIILCEAASHMTDGLRKLLPEGFPLEDWVGLVETSIGKMVPIMPTEARRRDPLEVWAEAYNTIIADREGFIGEPPAVAGLVCKRNFAPWVDRKLFIHNLGHAAAAYHGFLRGHTYVWECARDAEVRRLVQGAMRESAEALVRAHPGEFTRDDQAAHIEDLLERFENEALGDTVFRVGRDLPRKLAPDDRCIGALRLCQREGVEPAAIVGVIAAALHFKARDEHGELFPADAAFHARLASAGPETVLREVAGLVAAADARIVREILDQSRRMASAGNESA
ncbi:MAG: Mannitol-1-phosphate 5-dehydrogenase [candidate division BRC1 bacterium ADurb.BinA292]|nr:MAG: Mannitol-1-phosphate 5-dehydrogenase [candidate division BRC1 bacterium ADurb.BinA292]